MENPNPEPLDQSSVSENQDKTIDMYFGVFFDAMDMSLLAQHFNREEYMRKGEEAVSKAKDSSVYKTVDEVAAYAKFATDVLPDNPVSKYVNKGLEVKEKAEGMVDDAFGKVNDVNDSISNTMDKVPTSFGTGTEGEESEGGTGETLIGSRSIISKLEPRYVGGVPPTEEIEKNIGIKVSYSKSGVCYNYRIYTVGAVTNQEVKQKDAASDEEAPQMSDDTRKQIADGALEKVVGEITNAINPGPPKQSLHFDVFGYKKDPAVNNFIAEIDKFKQNPKVNELAIDCQGLYEEFHSKDEVQKSLGDSEGRFRNLDKL